MLFGLCQSLSREQNYLTTQYKVVFRLFEKPRIGDVVPILESENIGVDYSFRLQRRKKTQADVNCRFVSALILPFTNAMLD